MLGETTEEAGEAGGSSTAIFRLLVFVLHQPRCLDVVGAVSVAVSIDHGGQVRLRPRCWRHIAAGEGGVVFANDFSRSRQTAPCSIASESSRAPSLDRRSLIVEKKREAAIEEKSQNNDPVDSDGEEDLAEMSARLAERR